MFILGWLLIFLAAPLVIGYYLNEKKKGVWIRLAIVMIIVGLLLVLVG